MAQFNAMVLMLAAGAVIGTVVRPGVIEVAIVAAAVCGAAALYRRLSGRPDAEPEGVLSRGDS